MQLMSPMSKSNSDYIKKSLKEENYNCYTRRKIKPFQSARYEISLDKLLNGDVSLNTNLSPSF